VRAPQRPVGDGKQGVKIVRVKGAQPHHEATEIAMKGKRRRCIKCGIIARQLTRFAKPARGFAAHVMDGQR